MASELQEVPNFIDFESEAGVDWRAYFAARRAMLAGPAEPEEAEEPDEAAVDEQPEEAASSVIRPYTDCEIAHLPPKAKQIAQWAIDAGLTVHLGYHETHHEATVYKADSKKKDSDGNPVNVAGAPKSPAKQYVHWWVTAALYMQGKRVISFSAHWREGSFQEARTWDIVGTPVELYFDYSKGKPTKGPKVQLEAFDRRAEHLDSAYNDGTFNTTRELWRTSDTDFRAWLAELAELFHLTPIAVPKPRATKKQAPEPGDDMNLLDQGEWSA